MATSFLKRTAAQFSIKRGWSRRHYFANSILAVILFIVGFYAYRIFLLKDFADQSKTQIYSQLEEARIALRNLDPVGARQPLVKIDDEVKLIQDEANRYGVLSLSRFWGIVSEKVDAIPALLQNLAGISGTAIHLNDDIAYLKENAAELMINKRGPELLSRLLQFREKLARLTDYINKLDGQQSGFDEGALKSLASLRAEITKKNRSA